MTKFARETMHCKCCGRPMAWHDTLAIVRCENPRCDQYDRPFILAAAKRTPLDDFKPAA